MKLLYIIFFIHFIKISYAFHLNNYQIILINKLVQNPELTNFQRQKINNILYKAYEKFAIKTAIDFKQLHRYKCINIKTEEIILCSKIGLFKAIQKYNGKFNFIIYSKIYIKSELLKLLTQTFSTSILPKKIRTKNKSNISYSELIRYKQLLNVILTSKYEPYQVDLLFSYNDDILNKISKKYEDEETLNNLFDSLPTVYKRIAFLKYYSSDNILSNKHVSELMCCSEENIRQYIIKIKTKLNKINQNKIYYIK